MRKFRWLLFILTAVSICTFVSACQTQNDSASQIEGESVSISHNTGASAEEESSKQNSENPKENDKTEDNKTDSSSSSGKKDYYGPNV